ncbi:putative membrane protein [Halobacteriovorax marinus SJ]|uniref:Membrane protein n=1 Tax=Halobacteriovorax marinus (strain ATCC BAA-682 / DSM 15412 / SJ) TaxID=862908 RepID=E1X2C6_HALMS|nr:matrixin family metalloprotease [Halobacteriovorax marinus]CBW25082.1 putative membrane protein [Halobacteriovorax marinus SJ]
MNRLLITLIFFFSATAHSYVINRTESGEIIKWSSSKNINLFLSTSTPDLSSIDVNSIVTSSVAEWSSRVSNQVNLVTSNDGAVSGRNDIYFQSDDEFFSDSSIVAVTQYIVNSNTTYIHEADIILNDSIYTFSSNNLDTEYLGNVLTHEMGHLLGMGHSQVIESSMYYELRKGQATLHGDDDSGIRYLYGSSTLGTISGTVAGGKDALSVFGAHVTAFSLQTGEIVSAAVSDSNGDFTISNLPLNDTYFLYTEPLNNLGSLPNYYSVAKKDYCDSNQDYKGSFFQRCFGSDRGNPYGIKVNSSNKNINVGTVSIRCGLDVPGDYNRAKGSSYDISLVSSDINNYYVGSSSVGYFNSRIDAGTVKFDDVEDEYNLDLSLYDLYTYFPGKSLYLQVQVHTQPFFSPLRIVTTLDHDDFMTPSVYPNLGAPIDVDENGNYNVDVKLNLPLYADRTKNQYSLKIAPHNIDQLYGTSVVANIFSTGRYNYNESRHFYFITTRLVEKVGTDYLPVSEKNYGELTDNSSCLDASSTYQVTGNVVGSSAETLRKSVKKEDSLGLACGSVLYVDNSSPPGNGPLASLTLVAIFMLLSIKFNSSKIVE